MARRYDDRDFAPAPSRSAPRGSCVGIDRAESGQPRVLPTDGRALAPAARRARSARTEMRGVRTHIARVGRRTRTQPLALRSSAKSTQACTSASRRPPADAQRAWALQHSRDLDHRVPVSRRNRNTKEPVEPSQIADDLHVSSVHAEHKSVIRREDSEQPGASRRQAHRDRWCHTGRSGKNADEPNDVRPHGLSRERILGNQPADVAAVADDGLGVERKVARELGSNLQSRGWLTNDEGASRADIDGVEVL